METICPTCNSRINIDDERTSPENRDSITCDKCGNKIPLEPESGEPPNQEFQFETKTGHGNLETDEGTDSITEKDLRDFIGPDADKYIRKFGEFSVAGVDRFSMTWHWPAFFVCFFWMLYRKMYLWALIVFVVSYIPVLGIVLWIVYGLTGNYIYYKHAKKKIMELKALGASPDLSEELRRIGGINQWVVTVAVILAILAVVGILSAIIIPLIMFRN